MTAMCRIRTSAIETRLSVDLHCLAMYCLVRHYLVQAAVDAYNVLRPWEIALVR
jgi:hypothetical protein